MAPRRKIDQLPKKERDKVVTAIVEGETVRNISKRAARGRVGPTAVHRYKHEAMPALAAQALASRRVDTGALIIDRLNVQLSRLERLLEACDEWLADPDRPGKYTLLPRAEELEVVYRTMDPVTDKPMTRKARLSSLLALVQDGGDGAPPLEPIEVNNNQADPRELLVKAILGSRGTMELLAHILGEYKDKQEVSIEVRAQVLLAEVWGVIQKATKGSPGVLKRIEDGIALLDH
jgi:hypothetical protein